ncbi:YciI family protein [Sphingomonas sp.]|uniref:YciI family protein n=1 Tax=Sphingomonas sp. TaxID=28214 RepID=UPI0025FCD205|nr:YciI family protein [Sphingomonas sp.]
MADSYARCDAPLCVVILTYLIDVHEVDVHRPAHVDWLKLAYDNGVMLASGRQRPTTGGVLIFRGDKAAVEAIVATDPFVLNGVARAKVIHFVATMAEPLMVEALGA